MKENTLLIVSPNSGKNWSLQLYKSNPEKHAQLKSIVAGIVLQFSSPYKSLGLFVQGDTKDWTMIEMLGSNNESLFCDFCEFVSNKLNLEIEIE